MPSFFSELARFLSVSGTELLLDSLWWCLDRSLLSPRERSSWLLRDPGYTLPAIAPEGLDDSYGREGSSAVTPSTVGRAMTLRPWKRALFSWSIAVFAAEALSKITNTCPLRYLLLLFWGMSMVSIVLLSTLRWIHDRTSSARACCGNGDTWSFRCSVNM